MSRKPRILYCVSGVGGERGIASDDESNAKRSSPWPWMYESAIDSTKLPAFAKSVCRPTGIFQKHRISIGTQSIEPPTSVDTNVPRSSRRIMSNEWP